MDWAIDAESQPIGTGQSVCAGCGRQPIRGWTFAFRGVGLRAQVGGITKCVLCALRHLPMLRRSLSVAVVVGTVLTLLNHGDTLLIGQWNYSLYYKIPLTYCVPFSVATFAALTNGRR